MAFNKIQPEQIQMPTFFSDSGHLDISQSLDTGVQINIAKNLTGIFNITGQLLIENKSVFGLPNTGDNSFSVESGNILFAGANTEIGQDINNRDNIAIFSVNGDISGIRNVLVRGRSVTFNTGSQDNVCLAGNRVTFAKEATGSVGIKDNLATTSLDVENDNSLYIQFNSGHYFNGGNTYMGTPLSIESSGIISGNLNVIGDTLLSGNNQFGGVNSFRGQSSVVFESETLFSGENIVRGTTRFETGFAIPTWSGNGSQAGTAVAPATGALAISGNKLLIYTGHENVQGWGVVGIGTNP